MSKYISYRPVHGVYDHPHADNLSIVKVGQYTVCHPKEEAEKFTMGQLVCHVPPDICIAPFLANALGVAKYLKKCRYKNQGDKERCWVRSTRIRNIPSMGFITSISDVPIPEEELDEYFCVWKYQSEPLTEKQSPLISFDDHPQFPEYTKIQSIQLRPDAWTDNLPVRVTEKLHGQNCRIGVVQVDGEWEFMVGSSTAILREYPAPCNKCAEPRRSEFWELLDGRVMEMLNTLCEGTKPVVIYCERVGKGVRDLDYGLDKPQIRVYDLLIDGVYQPWDLIQAHCEQFKIPTVPHLVTTGFSWCMVEQFTNGNSVVTNPASIQSSYKGREGIVITPLEETYSAQLGGRLIGKSISVDYESRRGGTE